MVLDCECPQFACTLANELGDCKCTRLNFNISSFKTRKVKNFLTVRELRNILRCASATKPFSVSVANLLV